MRQFASPMTQSHAMPGRVAVRPVPAAALSNSSAPGRDFGHLSAVSSPRVLPKLAIGAVDDPLEREADRVADAVLRAPDAGARGGGAATIRQAAGEADGVPAPPIVHDTLRMPGQPLDAATRAFMEPRFGCDFSHVRVHTDSHAARSAKEIQALAYTAGAHIAFSANQYRPHATQGRALLAHELTHVIQGREGLSRKLTPESGTTPAKVDDATAAPCKVKTEFTLDDVRDAGWNIVNNDQTVNRAFLLYSQIRDVMKARRIAGDQDTDQQKELARFFKGEYSALVLNEKNPALAGETSRKQAGAAMHKQLHVNQSESFATAVMTYLHEMVHYANIWYSSTAARKFGKRTPTAEQKSGIEPADDDLTKDEQPNLTKGEQLSALPEYARSTIAPFISQLLGPASPDESPALKKERKRLEKAKAKKGDKFDLAKYLKRFESRRLFNFDQHYAGWQKNTENVAPGEGGAYGLEAGYAFEKQAYGFAATGDWTTDLEKKFIAKFCDYLR